MKSIVIILVTGLTLALRVQAQLLPLPEANESTIGFKTVEAALAALKVQSGVQITVQNGWTIADDQKNHTLWSFTPNDHPAYPSVVKRALTEHDGSVFINMNVLCEASKVACDGLVTQFEQLNDKLSQELQKKP
jgi:hypothetical protein